MRSSSIRLSSIAAVAITCWFATDAAAQEVCEQQAQAQTLFDEGRRLLDAGDAVEACAKLEGSVKLCPRFLGARGKLAECYEKSGKLASAWTAWRDVAGLGQKSGNDLDRRRAEYARNQAAALEGKLAYLRLQVPEASRLPGLVVERNGETVRPESFGVKVPIDAGTHAIAVRAPGHIQRDIQVAVVDGAGVEVEVPVLSPEPEPVQIENPGGASTTDVARARRSDRLLAALITGGAGAVAIGVGTGFGIAASSAFSDAKAAHGCTDAGVCPDAAGVNRVNDARRRATAANVLWAVGAVGLAGGAALWLTAPSAPDHDRGVSIAPAIARDSVGVGIGGSF